MAKKYVARCIVMRNGARVDDLKNFKILEDVYREEVDLMTGSGSVDRARKYKFSLDYAPPKNGAILDWSNVEDETFIVELEGGRRLVYSGVDSLSVGELTLDGQQEAVMTVTFIAAGKDEG